MTDRERLEKLAKEAEEHRTRELIERQQQEAARRQAEQDRVAEAKQKTDELRAYCEQTFKGFKLNPTGHEVSVGTAPMSKIQEIPDDGTEYVSLYISHFGDETGHFQGQIPILLCRYYGGMYEYAVGTQKKTKHAPNWDAFRETLLRWVAGFGRDEVGAVFERVRTMPRR